MYASETHGGADGGWSIESNGGVCPKPSYTTESYLVKSAHPRGPELDQKKTLGRSYRANTIYVLPAVRY